jgi:hypothetical protein
MSRPRLLLVACREVLDCASPLALFPTAAREPKAAEGCRSPRRWREFPAAISHAKRLDCVLFQRRFRPRLLL